MSELSIKETFVHNEQTYLSLLQLRESKCNPLFFNGCYTSVRSCINKRAIPSDKVIYVFRGKIVKATMTKAQVYVLEEYANEHILDPNTLYAKQEAEKAEKKTRTQKAQTERKAYDLSNLQSLPEEVELSDAEMFRDTSGNVLAIEVRGEKTTDGLYFKALDIEKGFGIHRMIDHIKDKTGSYTYGLHYKIFLLSPRNPGAEQKQMYLTYFGVVKMIVSSRSPNAEKFQRWVTNTLFVHQFGDQQQKDKMAAKLSNIHQSQIEAFRLSTTPISCVYLKCIGTISEVQEHVSVKIEGPDDGWVYKFGLTDNLNRRLKENRIAYGKWSKAEVHVEMYQYVDSALLSKAETFIKGIFDNGGMRINDGKHTELVVIPSEKMKFIREKYGEMMTLFGGNSKELIVQQEKREMNHKIEMINATHQSDMWENKYYLQQKDNMILQKDNELLNLRIKYECCTVV